jgi:glycosidase
LNYANPTVFCAMLEEMLFLANVGVEVLRLDALAFIWKQMGTTCENLPQAHMIVQAFNALVSIAAPAMVFKSEAIVHPDHVASYISGEECPLSYNPTLMALLWEALATREVKLLRHSMEKRFEMPSDCAWINYVRVHDDIGWSFADEDAAEVGINGFDHRQFLNQFYTGRFSGSFAMGLPFNYNQVTHDMRISGTAASLAGLEEAIKRDNPLFSEHALRRLLMLHSIILSVGGIPLIYIGDELASLNDYSFTKDPAKVKDSRWVHRGVFNWARAETRDDTSTYAGWLFEALTRLIGLRKKLPALAGSSATFFDTGNPHVLGYRRGDELLVLANFSERQQTIRFDTLADQWDFARSSVDRVSGLALGSDTVQLDTYQFIWVEYV